MLKLTKTLLLSTLLLLSFTANTFAVPVVIDLIGDKDQKEWVNADLENRDDGIGITHEEDDPAGFDEYQIWGYVSWTHDIADLLTGITIESVRLDIAAVGLIDKKWGDIDNQLYVDDTEIPYAFDYSIDGWRLYSFDIPVYMLLDGLLNITINIHPDEAWGGPDYSELFVYGKATGSSDIPAPVPEPATMVLLASGLAGVGCLKRKLKK